MSKDLLAKAVAVSSQAHSSQFDKGGQPYILHCIRVMQSVIRRFPHDTELAAIAILHDTVEDTEWTVEQVREEFNDTIADGVDAMSKRAGEDNDSYLSRVMSNVNASIVKVFDLKDNMDPMRIKGLRQKDFDRMVKYQRSFVMLQEHLRSKGVIV